MLETIERDLREALRAHREFDVSVLRFVKSALHNEAITLKKQKAGLTDEEAMAVMNSQAKKRREAADAFEKGGRPELAAKERKELAVINAYLPQQLDEAAVKKVVQETVAMFGDNAAFGAVMGAVMKKVKGRADGTFVSRVVKKELTPDPA
ncbi:MAG: GatB/YqeY domain-containing protein [Patescibacteria group bacterium]|nr:GatB/YqeY domain-containing protein [Patescibacteria group bacterium]MDD5715710.1 GatB/YqeY domain-containing protein [Patescibacteria group bacterium]